MREALCVALRLQFFGRRASEVAAETSKSLRDKGRTLFDWASLLARFFHCGILVFLKAGKASGLRAEAISRIVGAGKAGSKSQSFWPLEVSSAHKNHDAARKTSAVQSEQAFAAIRPDFELAQPLLSFEPGMSFYQHEGVAYVIENQSRLET